MTGNNRWQVDHVVFRESLYGNRARAERRDGFQAGLRTGMGGTITAEVTFTQLSVRGIPLLTRTLTASCRVPYPWERPMTEVDAD